MESTQLQELPNEAVTLISHIKGIVEQKKQIEAQEKDMKEQLQKVMEAYAIDKIDNDILKINYIKASTKFSVDSKQLKEDYPNIYEECLKTSNVKAHIKVEIKKGGK